MLLRRYHELNAPSNEVRLECIRRATRLELMPDEHASETSASPNVKEKGHVKEIGRKDCTCHRWLARHWCCNRQASGRGRSEGGHHIYERCRCGCVGRQRD